MNKRRKRFIYLSLEKPRLEPIDRAILEIKVVDILQRLLDWANRNIFKNFQLRFEMDEVVT